MQSRITLASTLSIATVLALQISILQEMPSMAQPGTQANTSAIDKAVIAAYQFRLAKNPRESLRVLKEVEKNATKHAGFFAERAADQVDLDNYAAAMKDCNTAIALDPKLADAYDRRAFCYAAAQQYDKAIADYTTTIKLNPRSPKPYHNRAIAYRQMGKLKEASADMKHYMTLRPDMMQGRNNADISKKADQLEKEGNIKGAIEYLKLQTKESPSPHLENHLGNLYVKTGDTAQAISIFSKVIAAADAAQKLPLSRTARISRALCNSKIKDYKAAINDCTTVIAQTEKPDPTSQQQAIARADRAVAFTLRANCYRHTKKIPEAFKDINLVIAQNPDLTPALETRGSIYQAAGKHAQAIEDFNKVIKSFPNSSKARSGRAESFVALKQYQPAIKDYTALIEKSPNSATSAYMGRAKIYQILHEDKKAEADFLKAHNERPD